MTVAHPLATAGYFGFSVPLFDGDHVTDDAGTGFVHTAPGHGRDDFDIWMASGKTLRERGIDTRIPYTVDADGFLTAGRARLRRAAASSTTRGTRATPTRPSSRR